ncbi:glycosyltransferase [Yinghuangia aomiensis]
MTSVAAVFVTYNRSAMLRESLLAMDASTRTPDEVIVVDNASADDTARMLAEEFPKVVHVRLAENTGPAGGFGEGMRVAVERGHDWAWLFNDDDHPEPGALARMLDAMPALPERTAMFASWLIDDRGEVAKLGVAWKNRILGHVAPPPDGGVRRRPADLRRRAGERRGRARTRAAQGGVLHDVGGDGVLHPRPPRGLVDPDPPRALGTHACTRAPRRPRRGGCTTRAATTWRWRSTTARPRRSGTGRSVRRSSPRSPWPARTARPPARERGRGGLGMRCGGRWGGRYCRAEARALMAGPGRRVPRPLFVRPRRAYIAPDLASGVRRAGGMSGVAVVGLGAIGSGVAGALVAAGHETAVYDVRSQAVQAFADRAKAAGSVAGSSSRFTCSRDRGRRRRPGDGSVRRGPPGACPAAPSCSCSARSPSPRSRPVPNVPTHSVCTSWTAG